MLYARGIPYEQCFDALNLTQPELIQGIHGEYISAGAQIIETNTFGANRTKLGAHHLADRVRDINFRAARLAREAREISGLPVFIADDPLTSVVLGAGKMLSDFALLKRVKWENTLQY